MMKLTAYVSGKVQEVGYRGRVVDIAKMDQMIDRQDELLVEVRDINRKFDKVLEKDIAELKSDMAEAKSALRAKGII